MTTDTLMSKDVEAWLDNAFRGEVPRAVQDLNHKREVQENVLREMFTQYDEELHDALERFFELNQTQHAMMYAVIEELFKRHLEDHAPSR